MRVVTVRNVQTLNEMMSEATQDVRDQVAKAGADVLPEVPREIGEGITRQLQQLDKDAEALLGEGLETKTLAGIASLKSHDNYTFEHSVDVAFYGVVLGRRLALDRAFLKDLAVGCLLHDIGKMYIDDRILTKPGKLSAKEFEQIKQHTVLGFQMLRQMPFDSPRPPQVALQHHEHQDGSGYPGKLFGTNQIFRTPPERFSPRRIALLAELGAVADVCSALSSDRPYRATLPTPEVVKNSAPDVGQASEQGGGRRVHRHGRAVPDRRRRPCGWREIRPLPGGGRGQLAAPARSTGRPSALRA